VRVFFNHERSSSWQQIGGRWAWSTLCVREWTKSVCTESAMRGTDFLRRGQLWRRRALEVNMEEGRWLWCWGQIGLINFLVKVAAFSEQQPRQKQQIVAFAYPAFGTQFVWAPWSLKTWVAVNQTACFNRTVGNVDAPM